MAKVTRGAGTAGIKSEATIANWFEDEDANSDKVWEYFRVI